MEPGKMSGWVFAAFACLITKIYPQDNFYKRPGIESIRCV